MRDSELGTTIAISFLSYWGKDMSCSQLEPGFFYALYTLDEWDLQAHPIFAVLYEQVYTERAPRLLGTGIITPILHNVDAPKYVCVCVRRVMVQKGGLGQSTRTMKSFK